MSGEIGRGKSGISPFGVTRIYLDKKRRVGIMYAKDFGLSSLKDNWNPKLRMQVAGSNESKTFEIHMPLPNGEGWSYRCYEFGSGRKEFVELHIVLREPTSKELKDLIIFHG